MTTTAGRGVIGGVQAVIGVDTHQDEHVAVAIDQQGVRLAQLSAPATSHGYEEVERWSRSLGEIRAFGIEGTGSCGAGLARFLTGRVLPSSRSTGLTGQLDTGRVRSTPPMRRRQPGRCWPE